jgi:hypothetical protein
MSGSSERQIYDIGAYQKSIEQSTNPLKYLLDPVSVARCDPRRPSQPGYNARVGVSITNRRPLIDVESDLLRLNYRHTKDPNRQYKPSCANCGVIEGACDCKEQLHHFPMCDNMFGEHTRISNPICNSREVGINRFQPLCLNPQDESRWLQPSEVGISYRNVIKDNHVPKIPVPLDPTPLLPKGQPGVKCPKVITPTSTTCGVYTAPMHKLGTVNRNWNRK